MEPTIIEWHHQHPQTQVFTFTLQKVVPRLWNGAGTFRREEQRKKIWSKWRILAWQVTRLHTITLRVNVAAACFRMTITVKRPCVNDLCVYVWKMNFFPRQLGWHWLYWRQTLYRYTHVEQISFLVSFFSKMRHSYLPPSPYQGLMDTFRNVQQNPNFLTDRKE